VNNVAPDPGSCTRETLVAARQGPEFFVIRSRAGRNGADLRNGEPTGKDNLLSLNRGVLPASAFLRSGRRWERRADQKRAVAFGKYITPHSTFV